MREKQNFKLKEPPMSDGVTELLEDWSEHSDADEYPDEFLTFFEALHGDCPNPRKYGSEEDLETYMRNRYHAWCGWFAGRMYLANNIKTMLKKLK